MRRSGKRNCPVFEMKSDHESNKCFHSRTVLSNKHSSEMGIFKVRAKLVTFQAWISRHQVYESTPVLLWRKTLSGLKIPTEFTAFLSGIDVVWGKTPGNTDFNCRSSAPVLKEILFWITCSNHAEILWALKPDCSPHQHSLLEGERTLKPCLIAGTASAQRFTPKITSRLDSD